MKGSKAERNKRDKEKQKNKVIIIIINFNLLSTGSAVIFSPLKLIPNGSVDFPSLSSQEKQFRFIMK